MTCWFFVIEYSGHIIVYIKKFIINFSGKEDSETFISQLNKKLTEEHRQIIQVCTSTFISITLQFSFSFEWRILINRMVHDVVHAFSVQNSSFITQGISTKLSQNDCYQVPCLILI
jgi:hypothetical protein